ncbi:MAG: aminopeptidase [Gammaproteobacteria bacterium]|nr:MAG: aminopeptidase [Gammaproteobacteria bacterium]
MRKPEPKTDSSLLTGLAGADLVAAGFVTTRLVATGLVADGFVTTRLVAGSVVTAGLAAAALMGAAATAQAGVEVDTTALEEAVSTEGIKVHLDAFQQIADENDGNRASASEGHLQSIAYVGRLLSLAGYKVNAQFFPYAYFEELDDAEFSRISPTAADHEYEEEEDFVTASYSGSGDVTATVEAVDTVLPAAPEADTSTSGCEAEDFADFTAGNIALLQRGSCPFGIKAMHAEAAGAAAVIFFNEGQEGRGETLRVSLEASAVGIPVIGTTYEIGKSLAVSDAVVHVKVDALTEERVTTSIIADSPIGRDDRTVVIGAHLDSVSEGAGINDNGSGAAAILEVALQMSRLGMLKSEDTDRRRRDDPSVRNRLRFAFWSAEELGLLGSEYYVATLPDEELGRIVASLNVDMVASPNPVRFVYDGDGSHSALAGPEGSAFLERLINDYFTEQDLASAPAGFDGNSDYGPFIAVGIPVGGLFTGADGIKTEEEVAVYGGEADEPYDPCYHDSCDDIDNINMQILDEMSDAIAHVVNVLAVNDLPQPKLTARTAYGITAIDMGLEYRDDRQLK